MTYKRLSEQEKQEILRLFQAEAESITGLAERYGVSSTTVRRILKGAVGSDVTELPLEEVSNGMEAIATHPPIAVPDPDFSSISESEAAVTGSNRRSRRRSSAPTSPPEPDVFVAPVPAHAQDDRQSAPLSGLDPEPAPILVEAVKPAPMKPVLKSARRQESLVLTEPEQELEEELEELEELDVDAEADLDFDDDLEEDLDDFEDDEEGGSASALEFQVKPDGLISIIPLAEASIPRTCYLVVDRSAELIARPLKDFGDLGQIPEPEVLEKTLPVFDNHRVAKRFSNPRTQRVIKLPDGKVLQKASTHLYAKGITRLLINGRVYSL